MEYQKQGLITLIAINFYFFKWNKWVFPFTFTKKRIQPPHHPYICTINTVHNVKYSTLTSLSRRYHQRIRLFSLASLSEWVVFLYVIRMQNKYCIKISTVCPMIHNFYSITNTIYRCGTEMAMLKVFFSFLLRTSYFVHLYV